MYCIYQELVWLAAYIKLCSILSCQIYYD